MKPFYILAVLLSLALSGYAQLRGRVTAPDGSPLPGAGVTLNNRHTSAGEAGEFSFAVPAGSYTVRIGHIGYRDTLLTLTVPQKEIAVIALNPSGILSEVTVSTGYQELPKERATGSFVQVDKALIERSVSTSVIDRLRDVVPGLHFDAGLETFKIQGQNTLFSNADPLIVVDGFPYNSPVGDINPNDVESITVLKDAAAASIWGTKAATGVVVIHDEAGGLQ